VSKKNENTPEVLSNKNQNKEIIKKDNISKSSLEIKTKELNNTNKKFIKITKKEITVTQTIVQVIQNTPKPILIKPDQSPNLIKTSEKNIIPTKIPTVIPTPTSTIIKKTSPTPKIKPIPTRNIKFVQTENFKLIATHTPTPTATPYPEIRLIFGNTIIGIVNEWALLKGGFVERQDPNIDMTAKISWGDSKLDEFDNLDIEWEGFTLSNMKKGYFKGRHIYTDEGDYNIKIIVKTETGEEFFIEGKALINFYD
tara:strand:+ start:2202 stop:2963 length:762 start_codon:yes stop_codon:yes gene_type:complete